jgi:hypothetical protein
MCKTHWNQYTAGLASDAKARKAAADTETSAPAVVAAEPAVEEAPPAESSAKRTRRAKSPEPVVDGQEATG